MPVRGPAPLSNPAGGHAYEDGTEFINSNTRHRDEAYLRNRWTY